MEYVVYALDDFGAAYPDVVELFPTRLAALTGRLKPLRVAAENTWLAVGDPQASSSTSSTT